MDEQKEEIIRKQLLSLGNRRYNALKKIKIDKLDFNPFLLRVLGLETPEEIAEFMVSQRMERGFVTSFGFHIQKILKLFSSGTGVEGADVCKEKDGRRYYIQIKAGPNTINKDISSEINRLLNSAIRRNHGAIGLLGMSYGTKSRVNSIIKRYSDIEWLIGRELWSFISDDADCARRIFEIAAEVAHTVPDNGKPYRERYKEKVAEIAGNIRDKYGEGDEMWDKLFEDNI